MNFFYFIFGLIFGIIAGLIPSIHINLIGAIIPFTSPDFLIPMTIVYSFLNTFPAILLQYVDESTITIKTLASKYVANSRGIEAIHLTILGSVVSSFVSLAFSGFLNVINLNTIRILDFLILSIILIYFLNIDYFTTVLFSCLGFISFSLKQGLFHVFSGSIAIYNFLHFNQSHIPIQKRINVHLFFYEFLLLIIVSLVAILLLFFPAVTSSIGIIPLMFIVRLFKNIKAQVYERLYFLFIGALNSASYVFAPFLLRYDIKRNYIVQVMKISNYSNLIPLSVVSIIFSYVISLFLLRYSVKFINKINLRFVNNGLLILTLLISFFYDGFQGLLLCFGSYFLLYILNVKNKPRYVILASIIAPVLIRKFF